MSDEQPRNIPLIILGIAMIAAGIGVIGLGVLRMGSMWKDTQLVVIPTETTLTFDSAGTYTIFHEYESIVDGVSYRGRRLPDELTIQLVDSDTPIEIESIGGYSNYSMGKRSGESAYRFAIEDPGDYVLNANYGDDDTQGQTVLSVAYWSFNMVRFSTWMGVLFLLEALGVSLLTKGFSRAKKPDPEKLSQGGYGYENSVEFKGDPTRALDHAHAVFGALGFTKVIISNGTLNAKGPGMQSTNQPPLRGATKIKIETRNSLLSLEAELGGVRFMRNFLIFFPPGLALFLGGIFALLTLGDGMPKGFGFMPLLIALPWLFISPGMIKTLRNKTTCALDELLSDMQTKT